MDDRKITIAVCGDSFCAASTVDLKHAGSRGHFSQILEDQYGYKILYFAHGAFSNIGICFQIQEAIKQKPHAIVYNTTWSSRFIMPRKPGHGFFAEAGLRNFLYFDQSCPSSQEPWGNQNAPLLCTVPQGIDSSHPWLSAEQLAALKYYYTYMYDDALSTTVDNWLVDYWHHKILDNDIMALRFNEQDIGAVAYEFTKNNHNYDTPFHTDLATQQQIADNIHCKMVDMLNKSK